ncbi:hypothetical protein ACWIE7_16380 [Dietzia sp. NPDC055343]
MLGDIVGDIVGFFYGLVGAGSAAANITGWTVVGSLDNIFDIW